MFVPIVLLYGLVCSLSAAAWQMILADEPERPPYHVTLATYLGGLSINFLTPMVNAGGEPYKVAALAPYLGFARATGAVILHTMLKATSFLIVWATALVLGLWLLPHRWPFIALETAALALVGLLGALLFTAHRHGGLEFLLDLLHRVPLLRRAGRAWEHHRPSLARLDRQIADFYRRAPGRFWRALALQYASRALLMLEFCLIAAALGLRLGYLQAFVIGGLEQLATNLAFFVPFELGTREAMSYLLWGWLGFDPAVGVFAAVVGRVRDFLWIGIGLLLILVGRRSTARAGAIRTAGGPA